jgi:hypothetical protein
MDELQKGIAEMDDLQKEGPEMGDLRKEDEAEVDDLHQKLAKATESEQAGRWSVTSSTVSSDRREEPPPRRGQVWGRESLLH